jgi:serine/threonine-protein kinase
VVNLERALALDPNNFFILQQIALACEDMRRFPKMAESHDRALSLLPKDPGNRAYRGLVDLEWRADPKPLRSAIQAIIADDPKDKTGIAPVWLYLTLCDRDFDGARQALSAMTSDGCRNEGIPLPRGWCEGVTARARGDPKAAQAAFSAARLELEKSLRTQPDYAEALCALGLVDGGLGRKEEAIREGERAVQLLPVSKDAINGGLLLEYLAIIYAWTGQTDRALQQLEIATKIPCDLSYGQLRLHPYWDPIRTDPRFQKIVESLAPK